MESGWITYYWSAPTSDALAAATGNLPSLGIAAGGIAQMDPTTGEPTGVIYGAEGSFYTVVRSQENIRTPAGLAIADPFDCTGLLGVFE